ncbi:nucleobase:cation symporter-1, NCS1 family, partial [Tremellales sp. Uapishka_1]
MSNFIRKRAARVKSEVVNFKLEVAREESSIAPAGVISNIDTDPSTPGQRTWGYGIWSLYWASDILVISGWQKVSAAIVLGLDWKNAVGAVLLGSIILTFPLCLNGRMGAVNRIPYVPHTVCRLNDLPDATPISSFPICIRASYGYHLAKFAIVSRCVTASFWFAIQGWNGGTCVRLMIGAIWPSFLKLQSHVSANQGYTVQTMVSYLIFWMIQFPLLFIHPSKLQPVFALKFVMVPICMMAILGWCVAQAKEQTGGLGAVLSQPPKADGADFAYAWLKTLTALISGFATLALNIPDFSRYSKGRNTPLVQAPLIPVIYTFLAITSAICGSCTQAIYGKALWSPVDIIAKWDSRAAVFFAAFAWMFAQMVQNLSANSISAANDLATLFPRYLNIRRAQIVIAVLAGWCLVPWKILASATTFYNFISGYGIVLGPFAGVMLFDYYIVKRQKLDVPALYDPHGRYRYNKFGCNWRAAVAFVVGFAPNIPGLVSSVNPHIHIGNARWIYAVSWLYGFLSSSFVYLILNWVWPDKTGSLVEKAVHPDDYLAEIRAEQTTRSETDDVDDEKKADSAVHVVSL